MTKYPILLVHGLGMRDDLRWASYWGKIPEKLTHKGIKYFFSKQHAFKTIEENALVIKTRILEICEQEGCTKVNIIAHSKGGIESRYLISGLQMSDYVASLTTLASPHRGASLADWALEKAEEYKALGIAENIFKILAIWQGDESPEILPAFKQMTTNEMKKFNQNFPDSEKVYYQSFAGSIKGGKYGVWAKFKDKIISEREGEHDSVVSVKSARWGNFRGIIKSPQGIGVSHHEMVGLSHVTDFNAPDFYIELINDLAEKGF